MWQYLETFQHLETKFSVALAEAILRTTLKFKFQFK